MPRLMKGRRFHGRRWLRHALGVALVLGAAGLAASGAQAEGSLERIKSRGRINVGYRDDAPPFSYLDAHGKPQGYSIDICTAVAASAARQLGTTGLEINMVQVPVDRVVSYLRDGTVDLLCSSTSDTPARRAAMSFSKPIFLDGVAVLVRKKDRIAHLGELAGAPVAAVQSTTAPQALQANPVSSAWKIEPVLNGDTGLSQLRLGWVKGFARDRVLLAVQRAALPNEDEFEILPELLSSERIAIALRKDDGPMQALVDRVITDAAASGKAAEWYDRWFMQPILLGDSRTTLAVPMSAELKAAMSAAR